MSRKRRNKSNNYTREASSFILIALGLLLLFAIVSHDRRDNPNIKIQNNSIQINNWIGRTGAAIADPLINYTLGYPIIILPIVIIIIGVNTFRAKELGYYLRPVLLLMTWAILSSILLALPEVFSTNGAIREYYPSGLVGGIVASYLVIYLGKFGSSLILISIIVALSIITLHIEIGGILNKIFETIKTFFTYVNNELNKWRENRLRKNKILVQEKKRFRDENRPLPVKPLEIKTSSDQPILEKTQKIIKESLLEEDDNKISNIESAEKPMIKTTLDDFLENVNGATIDTTLIKRSSGFGKDVIMDTSLNEDVDFEVQEEAQIEEVDYDKLVRESIAKYQFPSVDLLDNPPIEETSVTRDELKSNAELLEAKLMDFGLSAKVIRVTAGPVITLYELQPAPGVKVSQIVSLANDLALAMEARGIRMVAPIPGKAAIGIEIPNRRPQIVYLKPLIKSEAYAQSNFILPIALGKTINGEVYCADLTKMPHLLIAGSTGSGKSVGINSIIASICYKVDPGKVKFVMIDPKKIELSLYAKLSEHYLVWRTDLDEEVITKPSNAVSMLNSMVLEMESRYDKLAHLGVRGIEDYNERVRLGGPRVKEEKLQQLPYIIVIIDELADMMLVAAKEVETPIARLAQMARAVGIHLILATQRPSVDVITGVIKANFPARIAYMVTTRPDSKTILDANGAEQLLGNGDMLYQPPGEPKPIRLQNPLITTKEVERIISHIKKQPKLPHYGLPQPRDSNLSGSFESFNSNGDDKLYEEAKRIVVQHQQGSISLLQRRLKIGYSRAARLIDQMEEEGIVGPPDGSKPRQVYYLPEDL